MRGKNSSSSAKPVDRQIRLKAKQANFGSMNTASDSFTRPFPSNAEIGSRMRAARKKRGWTIAEMAEIGNIKAVVIGSYERGSRNMPISRLGEVARILGVNVAYLLGQPVIQRSSTQIRTIDLRAISRPSYSNPERLALLVTYCSGIIKSRGDWNGEILSIRDTDLLHLSFVTGLEQSEFATWLMQESYLIKEINHS